MKLDPIDDLAGEHGSILLALEHLSAAVAPIDKAKVREVLGFFRRFAVDYHMSKEEAVLQAMQACAPQENRAALRAFRDERSRALRFLASAEMALELLEGGDTAAAETLASTSTAFVSAMRALVAEAERTVLPAATRALPAYLSEELLEFFDEIRDKVFAHGMPASWLLLTEAPHLARQQVRRAPPDARTLTDEVRTRRFSAVEDRGDAESTFLYRSGDHSSVLLPSFGRGLSVQSNQHLIVHRNEAIILDPGGPKIYGDLLAHVTRQLDGAYLKYIFLSHEDPDILTSLNGWLMDTQATAYISRLWMRFVPHFTIDRLVEERLRAIPDEGMSLELAGAELKLIPAHFLHSSGNFHLYDPISKVLYTGDLGASLGAGEIFASSFDEHEPLMRGFHRRYMSSKKAGRAWAKRARRLDVEVIAPQHGAALRGRAMVERFYEWVETTDCGVDLLDA